MLSGSTTIARDSLVGDEHPTRKSRLDVEGVTSTPAQNSDAHPRSQSALQRSVTWADDKQQGHGLLVSSTGGNTRFNSPSNATSSTSLAERANHTQEPPASNPELTLSRSPSRDNAPLSRQLSMSDRLANMAHEQSILPAKAIEAAASHYNPSVTTRASTLSTNTRASTPSSAALAARASSGGRRSRPHSAQAKEALFDPVAVRNARKRWQSLRAAHLPKLYRLVLDGNEEDLLTLATSLGLGSGHYMKGQGGTIRPIAAIPYNLTIKHGFQYKYAMRHKHALLCVVHHHRIPMSSQEGRIGGKSSPDAEHDDESERTDVAAEQAKLRISTPGNEAPTTGGGGISIRKLPMYTFVTVDRTRQVTIWDVGRNGGPGKVRAVVKLQTDLAQFVFVREFCMYAGCSFDKSIKVCVLNIMCLFFWSCGVFVWVCLEVSEIGVLVVCFLGGGTTWGSV